MRGAFLLPGRASGSRYHDCLSLLDAGRHLDPILALVPDRLVAYITGTAHRFNPDFPRNLSKTLVLLFNLPPVNELGCDLACCALCASML